MPFLVRDVAGALVRKGFSERESHHTMYHFLHRGKDIGVSTKISHGEREIGDSLAAKMRKQMKLRTNAEFRNFVECEISQAAYEQILREEGVITDPAPEPN